MPVVPKFLFVVTEDWYFVSHRLALACAVKAAGFDVAVATRCGEQAQRIKEAGIRVIPLELSRRGMHPLTVAREVLRLVALYRHERPVIIHHVALKPVVVGGLAARLVGIPLVVSAVAGMGFLYTGEGRSPWVCWVIERMLPWLVGNGIAIVQNPEDQRILQTMGIAGDHLRLILGAGVDVVRFPFVPEPEGVPVVMLAARLLWDKGVAEFVAAARLLKSSGKRARFVLVGDPDPDNPASISDADSAAWQEEGVIEWWGHCDDMPATLCAATVVCLPSYREGLPKVLLEAMACGRPCVTTDVPGCRDAVRHEDNGLLVQVRDVEALAAAIERLLVSPALRMKLGRRGRERAEQEFSQDLVIAQTLAVYRELWSGVVTP